MSRACRMYRIMNKEILPNNAETPSMKKKNLKIIIPINEIFLAPSLLHTNYYTILNHRPNMFFFHKSQTRLGQILKEVWFHRIKGISNSCRAFTMTR